MNYFKTDEFFCKHGGKPCVTNIPLNLKLLSKLNDLRVIYNQPIIINSYYRCLKKNNAIGGSKSSNHLKGDAIDIAYKKDMKESLILWLKKNDDIRFCFYPNSNFFHFDLDIKKDKLFICSSKEWIFVDLEELKEVL